MGNFPLSNTIQKCNIVSKEQLYFNPIVCVFLEIWHLYAILIADFIAFTAVFLLTG